MDARAIDCTARAKHLSHSVEELLEQIGGRLDTKARNGTLMHMLAKRELVSEDCVELYTNLRLARHAVAHGQAAMPNVAESLEYERQANYLDAILRTVVQKLGQGKTDRPVEAGAVGTTRGTDDR